MERLPLHAWLSLPLALLAALVGLRLGLDHAAFERYVMSEQGLVELGTVVLLLPAIAFGVVSVRRQARLPAAWLKLWLLGLTAGCVYFAGEELSWGQHLFGWETPESLDALNDQGETNLHNMSSWLDQKPRLLLELWILAGAIAATLAAVGRRARTHALEWFWPGPRVALASWLAILVRLPERIADWTDADLPALISIRLSEIQELFFGLVLLLYLWSMARRLAGPGESGTAGGP